MLVTSFYSSTDRSLNCFLAGSLLRLAFNKSLAQNYNELNLSKNKLGLTEPKLDWLNKEAQQSEPKDFQVLSLALVNRS